MRRLLLVVGILGLVAALGLLVSRGAKSSDDAAVAVGSPSVASTAVATRTPAASLDPTAHSELEAARRSAVVAVSRTGEVVAAGMFSRGDIVATFATPSYAPRLTAETTAQVNAFLVALGVSGVDVTDVVVVETATTAAAQTTETGVRVRVWSVLVVTAPGVGVAREVWRTVTVDMIAVDGRWLVNGWTSEPGPAPVPAADGTFSDVEAVRDRLGWPAAGGD